jgi:hypothetical protein
MLAQRASRAWPATHQFEKLVRRELPSAKNFHLDTTIGDDDAPRVPTTTFSLAFSKSKFIVSLAFQELRL